MSQAQDPRAALKAARRIVVKIGSRAIQGEPGSAGRFQVIADQVAELRKRGHLVVLVSSGAVAIGADRLGLGERPRAVARLQAAAAVGQHRLLGAYERAFAKHGIEVAQLLITQTGITDRRRYLNARHAVDELLSLDVVPVINENDTVSTEEIEFGDNDQLAAMVSSLAGADLLVLLTDVEGVLDKGGARVSSFQNVAEAEELVWDEHDSFSLGGMGSKIGAARNALQRGLPVVIAPAKNHQVLAQLVGGEDVGTLFLPAGAAMASRKHWIAHALKMCGSLVVDAGAQRALCEKKRSLLPAGIMRCEGSFRAGDAVSILTQDGSELARGLCRYDARDVEKLLGARSDEIETRLGHYQGDEVVHRDDLVVL